MCLDTSCWNVYIFEQKPIQTKINQAFLYAKFGGTLGRVGGCRLSSVLSSRFFFFFFIFIFISFVYFFGGGGAKDADTWFVFGFFPICYTFSRILVFLFIYLVENNPLFGGMAQSTWKWNNIYRPDRSVCHTVQKEVLVHHNKKKRN